MLRHAICRFEGVTYVALPVPMNRSECGLLKWKLHMYMYTQSGELHYFGILQKLRTVRSYPRANSMLFSVDTERGVLLKGIWGVVREPVKNDMISTRPRSRHHCQQTRCTVTKRQLENNPCAHGKPAKQSTWSREGRKAFPFRAITEQLSSLCTSTQKVEEDRASRYKKISKRGGRWARCVRVMHDSHGKTWYEDITWKMKYHETVNTSQKVLRPNKLKSLGLWVSNHLQK